MSSNARGNETRDGKTKRRGTSGVADTLEFQKFAQERIGTEKEREDGRKSFERVDWNVKGNLEIHRLECTGYLEVHKLPWESMGYLDINRLHGDPHVT